MTGVQTCALPISAFLDLAARALPDGTRIIDEVLTQQEIASRIGSSREMVSRILKDLVAGSYVAVRNRRWVVLKKLPVKW